MQARYYDPVIGRFYSNDPVGFTGDITTFNRYSYVGNNPYAYTDPDGESRKRNQMRGAAVGYAVASAAEAFFDEGTPAHNKAVQMKKIYAKLMSGKTGKVHNNTKGDQPAEQYALKDRDTGDVKKYGETTQGEDKFGVGNQQRYSKKELKQNNVDYVKEASGTKKEMHELQTQKIKQHTKEHGERPPLNKTDS
jgi:hypothetical protein